MNAALRLCYQRVPSFRREHGGAYRLYVAFYSWAYAERMGYLHRRGRHVARRGLDPRCSWCGANLKR